MPCARLIACIVVIKSDETIPGNHYQLATKTVLDQLETTIPTKGQRHSVLQRQRINSMDDGRRRLYFNDHRRLLITNCLFMAFKLVLIVVNSN